MKQIRRKGWKQSFFFLIIPKPQKDELLSSWLTRVAFAHKRTLTTFCSLFIKYDGSSLSRIDIDFRYSEKLFELLSIKSGVEKRDILKMSIRSEEGYLFACDYCLYPPKIIRKLVDKRTNFGLMFCPKCLAEDEIPYWRKHWRYSFYNACEKHRVFLADRCGSCGERVRLSKMQVSEKIVYCSNCGRDLSLTETKKVPEDYYLGINAIQWFQKGLQNGYFIINKQKVHSIWIFQAHIRLKWLFYRKKELNLVGFSMLDDYKGLCKKLNHYNSKKGGEIHKQFFLTSMVYYLFQNYSNNFKIFIKDNKLTHRSFVHGLKHVSFWYENLIDQIVPVKNTIGREINESEVIGAIKYLKSKRIRVNQFEVAKIVGCHSTIHKGFVDIYRRINSKF